MFLWVIVASIAIAICLVLGQFMVRQLLFNNKIIGAKNEAHATLQSNAESFKTLKQEVNKLISNQNLSSLRVSETDTALQVIIDALPTSDDRVGLATSLQQIVLARSGVGIESINVIDGGQTIGGIAGEVPVASVGVTEIPFTVVIIGNYDQIQKALGDLEKSIRPISIDRIEIDGSGTQLRAAIAAKTFFLPAKTVEVKQETIKP